MSSNSYEDWKNSNWAKAHSEQDISALTGTSLTGHLQSLDVDGYLNKDTKLLCIGVGTGEWVTAASESVKRTWALDITTEAKKNIPPTVRLVTNPSILPTNYFDLAMSLWVAPHMSDFDLFDQIKEVVRSLKIWGILALHYKEPLDESLVVDNKAGLDEERLLAVQASMLRRKDYTQRLVQSADGKIVKRTTEKVSHFFNIREVTVHIMRIK